MFWRFLLNFIYTWIFSILVIGSSGLAAGTASCDTEELSFQNIVPNDQFSVPQSFGSSAPTFSGPPRNKFLQDKIQTLLNSKDDVLRFRSFVFSYEDQFSVIDDVDSHARLQGFCDYVAYGYQVPKELWPKCRIVPMMSLNAGLSAMGTIYFNAGIFSAFTNEHELLFLIAHELGHLVDMTHIKQSKLLGQLVRFQLNSNRLGSIFAQLPRSLLYFATDKGTTIVASQFSQYRESQADALGMSVGSYIGVDLDKAIVGFSKLMLAPDKARAQMSTIKLRLLDSHPLPKDRYLRLHFYRDQLSSTPSLPFHFNADFQRLRAAMIEHITNAHRQCL